jgi:CAAX amino terminal protease family protein
MEEGTFRGLFYNIVNIDHQQKFSLIFQAFLFGAWHIITQLYNLIDKDINFISFALFSIVYIILAVMM